MFACIIICIAILVIIASLFVISRLVYHRSVMSTIIEWFLRLTEKHYTEAELNKAIKERIENGDALCKKPKKSNWLEKEYQGMQVFYVNKEFKSESVVLYLHGGAYYRKPRKYHFSFINKMSKECNIPFIVPIYKKAPNHSCIEAYELLVGFYKKIKDQYKNVILMGDSSGGGLAQGLTMYLKKQKIDLPSTLVLLSPWIDVTLKNRDIEKYIKKDPLVFLDNVKLFGKLWANELSTNDYRVSPIYGEMDGLPTTHIFCGTREVLYPDCVLLFEKLKYSNTDVYFYKGEGQNHVYPIYPLIKEARKAQKTIKSIINKN